MSNVVKLPVYTLTKLQSMYENAIVKVLSQGDFQYMATEIVEGEYPKLTSADDIGKWAKKIFVCDANDYLDLPKTYVVDCGEFSVIVNGMDTLYCFSRDLTKE